MIKLSLLYSVFFFIFLNSVCFSNNQKNIDSLRNELKNSNNIEKIKLLNNLSKSLCGESLSESIEYGNKALKLSLEHKNKREEAKAYNNLGLICFTNSELDKAINYFNLSLSINKELNDSNKIIETLTYIGEFYYYKNNYIKAQEFYNKAFKIFNPKSDSLLLASLYNNFGDVFTELANYDKALIYFDKALIINKAKNNKLGIASNFNSTGNVYYLLGNYSKSFDYFKNSLELFNQLRQNFSIADLYINIGKINYQLKNYDKSIEFYQKSIKIKEQFNNKRGIAISLKNIGNTYYSLKDYDKALKYYKKSLSIQQKLKNKKEISKNLNNIGLVYIEKKQYKKAVDYFNKSISIKKGIDDVYGLANTYGNLCSLYKKEGDYKKAIKAYNQSQDMAKQINIKKNYLDNYEGLYTLYSKIGDYLNAYKYSKLYIDLYDTVYNYETQKKIAVFYNKLEIETKEKELQLLSKDKELQQAKILKQKIVNNIFFIGIIVIVVLLFLIYNRYLLKVKTNKKLEDEIDERKNAEKKLREAKKFIESLISNAQDGIVVFDLKGLIIQWNNAFLKMTGYEKSEITNLSYKEIVPSNWGKFNEQILNDLFKDNTQKHFEKEYIKKDGSVFPIRFSISIIKDENGKPTSVMSIITDITDEKVTNNELEKYKNHLEQLIIERTKELVIAKEKAEESDNLKTSFLANLSHEVRTPMNAIVGFSDLLADPDLTTDQREEYIKLISTSGNDLVLLIDDIIDLSKIETNQIRINKTDTNIEDILKEVYSYNSNKLKNKISDVVLKLNIKDCKNILINTDEFRLKQVISKLVDNSIKFTEKGAIELGCSYKEGNIIFFVKDTGIGIKKDKQKNVFKKFWKDESLIKNRRGTGLGLSIAQKFVGLLNGEVWFESDEKGTTFFVNIPIGDTKINSEKDRNKMKIDDYNWENKTILIAEDEQTNFQYLNEVLKITNAKVLWAKNGQEAVDLFNSTKNINIVLMDLKMPVLNGYEATSIIKQANTKIPIIAQTAYALTDERKKSDEAGCDDYLTKPIKIKKLLTTLKKYI